MTIRVPRIVRRVLRGILVALAILYFLIDLIFLSILRPLRRRLMALRPMVRLRVWVSKLNRYAALLLLVIPWLILEPCKPIGFLLFAHKHHLSATLMIVGSEIVKLTLFEQLFDMAKPQLMTFAWFAFLYNKWRQALAYFRSLPAWRRLLVWYHRWRRWLRRRCGFFYTFIAMLTGSHRRDAER